MILTTKLKNGKKGKTQESLIIKEENKVFIPVETLEFFNIKLKDIKRTTIEGSEYVNIDEIGKAKINTNNLSISLDIKPELMPNQSFMIGRDNTFGKIKSKPKKGFYSNYRIDWNQDVEKNLHYSFLSDSHLSTDTGENYNFSFNFNPEAEEQFSVLDAYMEKPFKDDLLKLRVGSGYTQANNIGNPARIVGIQLGTDFTLDPNFITMPTLSFEGLASVKGMADVFVNNQKIGNIELDAGKFDIGNVYSQNTVGGEAKVVIKDINGNQKIVTAPILGKPLNLAKGIDKYSASLGLLRYGTYDLGEPVLAANYARGVTDWLTLEGNVEASKGVLNTGIGGTIATDFGTFYGGLSKGLDGDRTKYGYIYRVNDFSFQVEKEKYQNYTVLGDPTPQTSNQTKASVNYRFNNDLNATASYAKGEDKGRAQLGLNYRINDNASAFVNFDKGFGESGFGLFVGFSYSFGDGKSLKTDSNYKKNEDGTYQNVIHEQIIYSKKDYTGLSAKFDRTDSYGTDKDKSSTDSATFEYKGYKANTGLNIARNTDDKQTLSGFIDGSVVPYDGDVHFTNRIYDSYAIVKTGKENIPIQHNNTVKGITNKDGIVIIPDLASNLDNTINIPYDKTPEDVVLEATEIKVNTYPMSPAVVEFKVKNMGFFLEVPNVKGEKLVVDGKTFFKASEGFYVDELNAGSFTGKIGDCNVEFIVPSDIGDSMPVIQPTKTCSIQNQGKDLLQGK
jgi:outer membrane usher protein